MNQTRIEILKHCFIAAVGLATFGTGIYLTIQANIGVAPWDCLFLGIEKNFGIKYGNVAVMTSLIVICVDLLMKERIGLGTLIDAVFTGKVVDFWNWADIVPQQQSTIMGIVLMIVALFICGLGQYIYMKVALCCGPRDSFLVGLSKRLKNIPIGIVCVMIQAIVLFFGWLLHGPIGIGTLIGAFLMGPIMELVFRICRFEAEEVHHQDLFASIKVISGNNK
ncbi:MAG: hypothetical protein IKU44_00300 [Firmicutes bacterium]|nr:hypothetical protein [Bacillota bacterium]